MALPTVLPLRIPNPFFEGRNEVYAILGDPITIIDTGIATQVAYDRLLEKLAENQIDVTAIGRIILTHKHIDHIGNAWRIQQASGAEIMIHESEVPSVVQSDAGGNRFRELVSERMQQWRVAADARPDDGTSNGQSWEIEPAAAVGLIDGQRIDLGEAELEVIHTPGHTYGSICLRLGDMLFTGDHVLKNTSPNVGGGDLRRRGLLKQFLSSLERMVQLSPEIETVYPGHGDPFSELAPRCLRLAKHHRASARPTGSDRKKKWRNVDLRNGGQTVRKIGQLSRRLGLRRSTITPGIFGRRRTGHAPRSSVPGSVDHFVNHSRLS